MTETNTMNPAEQPTTTQRLRDQTKTVKDDVAELGRLTREASREKIGEARQAAEDALEKGRRKVGDLEDSIVDYVREKPVKSVLLAAGAGALLGFLLSRR